MGVCTGQETKAKRIELVEALLELGAMYRKTGEAGRAAEKAEKKAEVKRAVDAELAAKSRTG